jgi:hypothetical protein
MLKCAGAVVVKNTTTAFSMTQTHGLHTDTDTSVRTQQNEVMARDRQKQVLNNIHANMLTKSYVIWDTTQNHQFLCMSNS